MFTKFNNLTALCHIGNQKFVYANIKHLFVRSICYAELKLVKMFPKTGLGVFSE